MRIVSLYGRRQGRIEFQKKALRTSHPKRLPIQQPLIPMPTFLASSRPLILPNSNFTPLILFIPPLPQANRSAAAAAAAAAALLFSSFCFSVCWCAYIITHLAFILFSHFVIAVHRGFGRWISADEPEAEAAVAPLGLEASVRGRHCDCLQDQSPTFSVGFHVDGRLAGDGRQRRRERPGTLSIMGKGGDVDPNQTWSTEASGEAIKRPE